MLNLEIPRLSDKPESVNSAEDNVWTALGCNGRSFRYFKFRDMQFPKTSLASHLLPFCFSSSQVRELASWEWPPSQTLRNKVWQPLYWVWVASHMGGFPMESQD